MATDKFKPTDDGNIYRCPLCPVVLTVDPMHDTTHAHTPCTCRNFKGDHDEDCYWGGGN